MVEDELDFHQVLHLLRSAELSRMPRTTGTVLSAGCADASYFAWVAECYGPIARHIGLELYAPTPRLLPDGVEWVRSSVADMAGVDDGSVSLVFSGQNFEHLFDDDAIGFLLECRRVLEPAGAIVIDSPNRDVASAANWVQPEHTIEFSPDEAVELVTLAGFDVTSLRGIWHCGDPANGAAIELWPEGGALSTAEIVRRAVLAESAPRESFIWWLEATRSLREPDIAALRCRHAQIHAAAWQERMQRLRHHVGTRHDEDGRAVLDVAQDECGFAMFGPYMPLVPGQHVAEFTLRRVSDCLDEVEVALLDVSDAAGVALAQLEVPASALPIGEWRTFAVRATVAQLTWGGQCRVRSTGAAAFQLAFRGSITLAETDAAPLTETDAAPLSESDAAAAPSPDQAVRA